MARDRHRGRTSFGVQADPIAFTNLIRQQGVRCNIRRARKCPCSRFGSPVPSCRICRGDGFVYDFQRKLLEVDEKSETSIDGNLFCVLPFRVPLIQPVSVERLIADEQGGIRKYNIDGFNETAIFISDPEDQQLLPKNYEILRVSYFFDRYTKVESELVEVDTSTNTLTTRATRFDDGHKSGNVLNMHGAIAQIDEIKNVETDFRYESFSYRKNQIHIIGGPPLEENKIAVTYYYVGLEPVLVQELSTGEIKETWTSILSQGPVKMSMDHWFEISSGDLVTVMSSEFWRDEVMVHSGHGFDRLTEYDISRVDDEILDEDGGRFIQGTDFKLRKGEEVAWCGNQPAAGKKISVRYAYHPTYILFRDNPVPNNMENRAFPVTMNAHLWNRTMKKEIEVKENPGLNRGTAFNPGSPFSVGAIPTL